MKGSGWRKDEGAGRPRQILFRLVFMETIRDVRKKGNADGNIDKFPLHVGQSF